MFLRSTQMKLKLIQYITSLCSNMCTSLNIQAHRISFHLCIIFPPGQFESETFAHKKSTNMQKIKAPTVSAPKITGPEFSAPKVPAPEISASKVSARPRVSALQVSNLQFLQKSFHYPNAPKDAIGSKNVTGLIMLGIYLYIECMNSLQILQLPVTQSLALYITSLCPGGPGNRFQMLKSLVLIFQLPRVIRFTVCN